MLLRKPDYYDSFRCLASSCPDSCCTQWGVVVDPETEARYRALPGDLGRTLRDSMLREEGETLLFSQGRRCPFLQGDGLCRIHRELGEEGLCRVCREFPRIAHDYGNFVEMQLELSCPRAAELIFQWDGAMVTETVPGGDDPDYSREDMSLLLEARETVLEGLSRATPNAGLAMLLQKAIAVQRQLDGMEQTEHIPREPGRVEDIRDLFLGLEILTDQWRALLTQSAPRPLPEEITAMARYLTYRYWLQSVSDLDLYARAKLMVASCLLVSSLPGNIAQNAQLFSKEIENDPDNVDALLDAAYESPAITDGKLLWLLENL